MTSYIPSRLDFAKERFGGPFTTEQVETAKNFLESYLSWSTPPLPPPPPPPPPLFGAHFHSYLDKRQGFTPLPPPDPTHTHMRRHTHKDAICMANLHTGTEKTYSKLTSSICKRLYTENDCMTSYILSNETGEERIEYVLQEFPFPSSPPPTLPQGDH